MLVCTSAQGCINAEWLPKIVESGVHIRAERLYQQMDGLQPFGSASPTLMALFQWVLSAITTLVIPSLLTSHGRPTIPWRICKDSEKREATDVGHYCPAKDS
jgi:hypothetical protein